MFNCTTEPGLSLLCSRSLIVQHNVPVCFDQLLLQLQDSRSHQRIASKSRLDELLGILILAPKLQESFFASVRRT